MTTRDLMRKSSDLRRDAGREYMRQRVTLREREIRRETDEEIRAVLRGMERRA